jgi:hypothetical protein
MSPNQMMPVQASEGAVRPSQTFPLQGGVSASLLFGIGLALVVEGVGLHVWIAPRSEFWAWTITALNLATLVWLWRDYQARLRAKLTLGENEVVVALGNQLRCRFPRSAIASTDVATWRSVPDPDMARDYVNTAKPLEPNVLIVLRDPIEARLPLGIRKRVTRLGVRVADPQRVISELQTP